MGRVTGNAVVRAGDITAELTSVGIPTAKFSQDSTVSATTSPPDVSRAVRQFHFVVAGLKTAGSTDTIAEVQVSGTTELAITIPASATSASAEIDLPVAALAPIQVEITQAGTGAEGFYLCLEP